jgi:hypothetical protein
LSAALVCLVWADAKSDQQTAIAHCTGNYNDCVQGCTTVFPPKYDKERWIKCCSPCLADMITCINGTVSAVAPGQPGQAPPPRLPPPPTAPPSNTNPISAPIPGPSAIAPPNATPPPKPTPTTNPLKHKPTPRPPHKGSSPTATPSHPILLSKPKTTPSPKPTPKSSTSHSSDHHHH